MSEQPDLFANIPMEVRVAAIPLDRQEAQRVAMKPWEYSLASHKLASRILGEIGLVQLKHRVEEHIAMKLYKDA